MLQRNESYFFLPVPFALALCGMVFCIWNIHGGDSIPCVSAGCTLFHDFTLAGFSLWWPGAAGFAISALCAMSGRLVLGKFWASLTLFFDCLLLILMLSTSPCLPCLLASLLLALAYLSFLLAAHAKKRSFAGLQFSILLVVWGCLFIANFGALAREHARPWAMQAPINDQDLVARAYFSPSCPACLQLVRELPPDQTAKLAWYPVAETNRDLSVIAAMQERLRQGDSIPQALATAIDTPLAGQWALFQADMLLLQFRLWRNQAHVINSGNTLPLLEFTGVPSFMTQPRRIDAPPSQPKTVPQPVDQDLSLPPELTIIGRCGPQDDALCP